MNYTVVQYFILHWSIGDLILYLSRKYTNIEIKTFLRVNILIVLECKSVRSSSFRDCGKSSFQDRIKRSQQKGSTERKKKRKYRSRRRFEWKGTVYERSGGKKEDGGHPGCSRNVGWSGSTDPRTVSPRHVDVVSRMLARGATCRENKETTATVAYLNKRP